ncbi:hypothetical protein ACHAXT_005421 [Thalassiosira profunda]
MRSWLALVLHAAAVAGAIANHDEEAAGPSAHLLGSSNRRLTQSLLEYFFTMSQPRVDRCWAVTAVDDATGEERPAINCDFTVPKKFNSTAGIRMGPCADLDEPICTEKVSGECTSLMVVASGRVRTTAFLKLPPREVASETNHTYCARADVYQDLDGSGEQISVEHAEREIIVAFTGGDTDNYVGMEEMDKKSGGAIAAIAGSVVGILILVPVVAFFSTKGRRGGTKIHDTTEGKPDDETAEEVDDDTIEIV